MTTTTYTDYPFISYGVKFISRVFDNFSMANQIAMLPEGVFAQINFEALTELVGDASLFTRDELLAELERVNEGGTHSFILLDEENN